MTETLISVDVEASGPIPGRYSLLSIGACAVDNPEDTFYVELQPIGDEFIPEALAVSGLDMKHLHSCGARASDAMLSFAEWLRKFKRPICVAFNASFDWAFINYYFLEFGPEHRNPFGIGALDVKAYAMGRLDTSWDDTRSSRLAARLGLSLESDHNALRDAQMQAKLFGAIRNA